MRLQLRTQQAHGGLKQRIWIDWRKAGGGLAREGQEAGDQRFRAAHLLADHPGLMFFLARQIRCAEQIGVAQHRRERIVDLVRRAADQLAERGQLFGLNELLLKKL